MSTALADAVVAMAGAAAGTANLAWGIQYNKLEGERAGVGERFFSAVVGSATLVALGWAMFSLWSIAPALVVLAPLPPGFAAVVTVQLTRRWKPPVRR